MQTKGASHLSVVDNDNNTIGFVTFDDFLELLVDELGLFVKLIPHDHKK